jgi:3-methylcrotonyl-CoA carboxylase alpha subunit
MMQAGVPVIPGYDGGNQDPDFLLERAKEIGFPVMIKASAGGGGRGIRRVESENSFMGSLFSARREALNFFSNETVFIEKFVTNPRHIEVQVFGDSFGNAVHLYERDCSVQRKNQKLIEECPSVNLSEKILESIYQSSITACTSIGYKNAGTVEFVVSGEDYYFLEMNTRLQVEHPVTEMITGLDLVECQIRIAEGESVYDIFPAKIPKKGHSIELRICAEEGGNNPIPQTGKIQFVHFPIEKNLRLDSGIEAGSVVSPFYDSMIAKFISYGDTREICLQNLEDALSDSAILGISTNINYLRSILQNEDFRKGGVTTAFVEKSLKVRERERRILLESICVAHICNSIREEKNSQELFSNFRVWEDRKSFYETHFSHLHSLYHFQGKFFTIDEGMIQDIVEYKVQGETYKVYCAEKGERELIFHVESNSLSENLFLEIPFLQENRIHFSNKNNWYFVKNGTKIFLSYHSENFTVQIVDYSTHAKANTNTVFKSPMPGKIISIKVKKGEIVEEGTPLITIEAMKMENIIYAPAKLLVEEIYFSEGQQVVSEAELLKVNYASV